MGVQVPPPTRTPSSVAQRAAADRQVVNEQLHQVLNTRIVIEQAKGMVAEVTGLGLDQAFSALRQHARGHKVPAPQAEAPVVPAVDPDVAGRRRAETLGLLREMAADASQGHALGREDFGT